MADWFKVYETDLDDELLQWAMTEQPCTGIVYFAILSKCCKEHSPSFPWSTDCALLAMANKVHAGVGLVNDALGMLQKIGMISISGGILTVNNWSSRQSEYCQRKEKKVSRHYPDNVPTVSPERRGEERRLKEGRKTPKALELKGVPGGNLNSLSVRVADRGGVREEELRDEVPPGTYGSLSK